MATTSTRRIRSSITGIPAVRRIAIATLLATLLALVALALLPQQADAGPVTTTATQRSKAATAAVAKVGAQYRMGASGPTRFDCSGLVLYGYRMAGTTLPVRTSQDMFRLGARVSRSNLRRGDLVWTWDTSKGHVGVYLGKGKYVHAPGSGRKVAVAPLPSGSAFVGAVRP